MKNRRLRSASTTILSTTTASAAVAASSTHNPMALSLSNAGRSASGEELAPTSHRSKEEEHVLIQVCVCERGVSEYLCVLPMCACVCVCVCVLFFRFLMCCFVYCVIFVVVAVILGFPTHRM
jgi:hypothetical protein